MIEFYYPKMSVDEAIAVYAFWKMPLNCQFHMNFQKPDLKFGEFWIITERAIFVNSELGHGTLEKQARSASQLRLNKHKKLAP